MPCANRKGFPSSVVSLACCLLVRLLLAGPAAAKELFPVVLSPWRAAWLAMPSAETNAIDAN